MSNLKEYYDMNSGRIISNLSNLKIYYELMAQADNLAKNRMAAVWNVSATEGIPDSEVSQEVLELRDFYRTLDLYRDITYHERAEIAYRSYTKDH